MKLAATLRLNIESLISAFRLIILGSDAQDKCVTAELADGNYNKLSVAWKTNLIVLSLLE